MFKHKDLLKKLGQDILLESQSIESIGLGIVNSVITTALEFLTDNERRTSRYSYLWIHQYHLTDEETEEFKNISPLTLREDTILAACTILLNIETLGNSVPYDIMYAKKLAEFVGKELIEY